MRRKPVRRGRRLSLPANGAHLIAALSALASVVGVLVVLLVGAAGGASDVRRHAGYAIGGVEVNIDSIAWLSHDMFGGPMPKTAKNFPMPAQMMPGMPTSDVNRLHVELTITNHDGSPAGYMASQFRAESAAGKSWGPTGDSQPDQAALPANSAMAVELFFDIPVNQQARAILFTRGTRTLTIPLVAGQAPAHHH